MRVPRWLLVLLLTVAVLLPVFLAGVWVVGPALTARRFIRLLRAGQFEEGSKMMANAHFVREHGNVCLESADREYCFAPAGWAQALSESNTEYHANGIWDWLSGKREIGIRHQDFYVTFKFQAGPRTVRFCELYPYFEQKRAYKEFSIYGFSPRLVSTDPICVEGDYTFGDPDGGFIVLLVNGEEQDRSPAHIAYGTFKLTSKVRTADTAQYRIEVVDKVGNLRNKYERVIEP